MDNTYDLGIVGAGIIGACTAWYAKKRFPNWRIALIDRSIAGHGASLYSASLDVPYGHTPLRRALTQRSRQLYEELRAEIKDLPISSIPVVSLVHKDATDRTLLQFIDQQTKLATGAEMAALQQQFPPFIIPDDNNVLVGTVGNRAVRNWVACRIAEEFGKCEGAALLEGVSIESVTSKKDHHALRTAHNQLIKVNKLIVATGPWLSNGFAGAYAKQAKIRNKKVIAFHLPSPPPVSAPVFHFFDDEAFLLPRPEAGQWLFSVRSEDWDVSPDPSTLTISEKEKKLATSILKKYFPSLIAKPMGGRVFCDAYGEGGDPVIRQVADRDDYLIVGAGSGSGFRLGPAMAEKAVALLEASVPGVREENAGPKIYDSIIIGAGQAGLANAYLLQKKGLDFVLFEKQAEVSGSWSHYYESLTLFTPLPFSQLHGFSMKKDPKSYLTRVEMMKYLRDYCRHFNFPIHTSCPTEKVEKINKLFKVTTPKGVFWSKTLINASGPYCDPVMPKYPNQEQFRGRILHSYDYKNPEGFEGKRVVIVGSGNSAIQIAYELKDLARVTLASRRPIKWISQHILGQDIHWWMHLIGIEHLPIRTKPKSPIPVIDTGKYKAAIKKKLFDRRPMFMAFTPEGIVWSDGTTEEVDIVIYATGFRPKMEWLKPLDVLDEKGGIKQKLGVSTEFPGLFFAGVFLQRNPASGNIWGAPYDAEYVVRRLLHFLGLSKRSAWWDERQVAFRQRFRRKN